MSFGKLLAAGFEQERRLCVGIDPHSYLLEEWNLDDSAAGAEIFGREVVAASHEAGALVLKPQIAFYERFGSRGYAALERVLADTRAAGIPVIADVKRGDIGTSFAAYAAAWLQHGSPLEVDAITVAAYQGFGSLQAGLDLARQHGKGMFVLAATSNPEASGVQQAVQSDNSTVAAGIITSSCDYNTAHATAAVGDVGVVLGATLNLADYGIDTSQTPNPVLPILAPGFGAQGAKLDDAKQIFGSLCAGVLPNESRAVLAGGKSGLSERIRTRSAIIAEALA